jgi:hypothetical protein
MDVEHKAYVILDVPPLARTGRLLTQTFGWTMHYQWLVEDAEGHIEIRRIDSGSLRSDDVDPSDAVAVATHVERRMMAEGVDFIRRPAEEQPVVASWTIQRRGPDAGASNGHRP